MAQRLVRKLCQDCKVEKTPTDREKATVERIIKSIVDPTYLEGLDPQKMWEAKGCIKCNFTGYKGRVGVYEAIRTDAEIERVVQENPSEREIKKAAAPQKILDMQQDGMIKILQGVTSIEELQRVIDLEEEA
jgi:type IV pilus assembly protein PilB